VKTWNQAAQDAVFSILETPKDQTDDGFPLTVIDLRSWHTRLMLAVEANSNEEAIIRLWQEFGITSLYRIYQDTEVSVHDIVEILIRKQRDYGPENIAKFGRFGLVVRTHDKVARLENLLATGNKPSNESVLDTLIDIVGYSAIGIMWEKDEFLLSLA
jgi:hypothetical protein